MGYCVKYISADELGGVGIALCYRTPMSAEVEALLARALQARRENRQAEAKPDLVEAVNLCRRYGEPLLLARSLTSLGQIERDLRHAEAALQHYEEAAAIYRSAGDLLKLAHTVRHIGDILQDEGRLIQAEPHYREAMEIYRAHPETPPLDLANAIRGYALLQGATGKRQEAIALWQEAGKLYASVGVEAGVAESARRIALLSA
jgi:tetratricopeptide (TPR) repeat protein